MISKSRTNKKNIIAIMVIIVLAGIIGRWVQSIGDNSGAAMRAQDVSFVRKSSGFTAVENPDTPLGAQDAGFFQSVKDTIVGTARSLVFGKAKDNVIKSYQERYGDDWSKKIKEDFAGGALSIYKAAYGKDYKEKMKEDIVKEYKGRYGDKYREKIKEDYKGEAIEYYKQEYGDRYKDVFSQDVQDYYKKEFGVKYKEKMKEELGRDIDDYYKKEYGADYEKAIKEDYEKYQK